MTSMPVSMACGIYTSIETCHSISTEIDSGTPTADQDDYDLASGVIGILVVANASKQDSTQAALSRLGPPV
jgi:hypothetical protein